ncbi:hypothetical protein KGF57_000189 [Candida theae]|uniref:Uncharacterized protein n=1 Tax=Candida theae TaxID=1198502 RepID=A0AAD5BJJ3_9ASCO|nr:uncharacterized protein KGF57_000189 [Candida theae]KAI5968495.1 hypothetical protein KGF57_000189 [Candida theae]
MRGHMNHWLSVFEHYMHVKMQAQVRIVFETGDTGADSASNDSNNMSKLKCDTFNHFCDDEFGLLPVWFVASLVCCQSGSA